MHGLSGSTLVRTIIVILLVLPAVVVVIVMIWFVCACVPGTILSTLYVFESSHWSCQVVLSLALFFWMRKRSKREVKTPAEVTHLSEGWIGVYTKATPMAAEHTQVVNQTTPPPSSFYPVMFPTVSYGHHERKSDKFHSPCIVCLQIFHRLIHWCLVAPSSPLGSKKKTFWRPCS